MLQSLWTVLVCVVMATAVAPAHSYPENYLSAKLGASISTPCQLNKSSKAQNLLSDGPVATGSILFSRSGQPRSFTVDFGQTRTFDRVDWGAGGDCRHVKIEVSDKSADGPYEAIFEKGDLGGFQVLRLPLCKARWVRFDLGPGDPGGAYSVRIFKGYEHPRLVEVTKLLHAQISPNLPGLERFYAAADKGDWKRACKELRAYYAARHKPDGKPNPQYDLTRVTDLYNGKLDYAGIVNTQKIPIDWAYQKNGDWYEHKNFLNRGAILGVPMAAYYQTGDKKWLKFARDMFYDWIDANPKPTIMSGADYPTWRTLDSAARSGWLVTRFPEVCVTKGFDDELWANLLYSIWEICDYLKNDNFTGGNWLAHSSSSVMGIAELFPEFKDLKIWLAYGKSAFERNVLRDVLPDGKEMEDAPGYVAFACKAMLSTLMSLEKNGISVDPEARRRMDRSQDWLGAVTQPDGNTPNIGDWGGGEAYSLHTSQPFFKREDIKYILTKGKEGTVPTFCSTNFPQGGWSFMRSPYEEQPYENARHLTFHTSQGAHGHRDINGITAYAYGRELLIDPGTRSYEGADRDRYPVVKYHNTVCVDGKNYEEKDGKTEKWVSNAGIDYVLGSHGNYTGLTHRRSVLFVKPDYWVVHDDVYGSGEHTYDQNWHFAVDAGITENPSTKSVRTSYPDKGNLLMVPADPAGIKSEPIEFYVATQRMGGAKGEALSKGWKYAKSGPAPQSFDVVLHPYQGATAPDVSVRSLQVENADPKDITALEVKRGEFTDYILVSRAGPREMTAPAVGLKVNAEIAVVRVKGGAIVSVAGEKITGEPALGK